MFHQKTVDEDISAIDAAQEDHKNAAFTLFESLRVTFEDVEEFLDDGLVVIPRNDDAVHYITANCGDVFLARCSGLSGWRHDRIMTSSIPLWLSQLLS